MGITQLFKDRRSPVEKVGLMMTLILERTLIGHLHTSIEPLTTADRLLEVIAQLPLHQRG
jgi:hypothetical protein